jgi:hypothetical protein
MTTLGDGTMVMAVGTVGDDGKIVNMHIALELTAVSFPGNTTTLVYSSGAVYIFEKKPSATNFTETQVGLRTVPYPLGDSTSDVTHPLTLVIATTLL